MLGRLGAPPARVLEVGCGDGELARASARAGHSVTAVDPLAPESGSEGPTFRRANLEDLSDTGPFDHVVACLVWHHVEDLGSALDKTAELLGAGGTLIVVEFAWDRFDEGTADWALERLTATSSSEKPSWLERCCREWARGDAAGTRTTAEAHFAGWASGQGLHGSRRMRDELERRFEERLFAWTPYLYPELGGTSEENETAAIEAGTINATGFRYVGASRASASGTLRDRAG